MKKKVLFLLFVLISTLTNAQVAPVKEELRGVWIAALGIDWPSTTGTSASAIQSQKNELISLLNAHKATELNAIFFHIRPLCDALYKSKIEPWSNFLTGTIGAAPSDPNYDPLTFAIQESHKRGMELHAWLNPYRAMMTSGDPSSLPPEHVIKKHPEWIIKCSTSEYRFLNPGLPQVREYVTSVVMDIVRRYDVDGIHFDDYFYPYTEYGPYNDDATFAKYPNGFTEKAKWRENNVNLLLQMLNDSIKAVKPWVKFGVSPSGNPSVNTGIYCNPGNWLSGTYTDTTGKAHVDGPYIDYIMPQLYWERYGQNLPLWASNSFLHDRHLYVGQAAYRYSTFSADELSWEIKANRGTSTCKGGVFFSAKSLINNLAGCSDTLRYNYFVHPSVPPKMSWIPGSNTKPNAPTNIRFELNATTQKYELKWDKPAAAADGDTAVRYVVYRFENSNGSVDDPNNIFGMTGETYLASNYSKMSVTKGNYYLVTAFDRYSNESTPGTPILFDASSLVPSKPELTAPVNGDENQGGTATLKWNAAPKAERYSIQVSTDSTFKTNLLMNVMEYSGTQAAFKKVSVNNVYYWHVKAYNLGGESQYSQIFRFAAGFPTVPVLVEPAHTSTNVTLDPVLKWNKSPKATKYRVQVSLDANFTSSIIKDVTIADTFYALSGLAKLKIHFWRVSASNNLGGSGFSKNFGFKTGDGSVGVEEDKNQPVEYNLAQNFPNPFNPATVINYSLAKPGNVKLTVYDILGNEVAILVDRYQAAGHYSARLDVNSFGKKLVSGIYIYTLRADSYTNTRKMILLK